MSRSLLDVIDEALLRVDDELEVAGDPRELEAAREALTQARLWERRRLGLEPQEHAVSQGRPTGPAGSVRRSP